MRLVDRLNRRYNKCAGLDFMRFHNGYAFEINAMGA